MMMGCVCDVVLLLAFAFCFCFASLEKNKIIRLLVRPKTLMKKRRNGYRQTTIVPDGTLAGVPIIVALTRDFILGAAVAASGFASPWSAVKCNQCERGLFSQLSNRAIARRNDGSPCCCSRLVFWWKIRITICTHFRARIDKYDRVLDKRGIRRMMPDITVLCSQEHFHNNALPPVNLAIP